MNSKQRRKQGRDLITLFKEASEDDKDRTITEMARSLLRMENELNVLRRLSKTALKDHEIRELVNELRDVAVEYHSTQQLRDRLSDVVHDFLSTGIVRSDTLPPTDPVKAHTAHCCGCEVCNAWRTYLNE